MILGYSHNIPQKSQDTRVIETSGTIAKEIPNQTKPTSTDLRAVAPCTFINPVTKYQNFRRQIANLTLVKTKALSLLLLGSWIRKGYLKP